MAKRRVAAKRGRGRPEFKATPARRRRVEELVSGGMSHDDIARVLGCSDETLRKHFEDELRTGSAKKRAEADALLWESARAGNASSIRRLIERLDTAATARRPPEPTQQKPPALGKKEELQRAAEHPDTSTSMGELMAKRIAAEGPKTVN